MNNISQAVWVEMLKARRSRVPFLTALGSSMLPLAGSFFMVVLRDPELALRVGLISAKAQITMGVADWPAYLGFLTMGVAIAGVVIFGFIGSWVFGREYSDRTVKDLLALPTGRSTIVLAKFILVVLWSASLVVLIYLVALFVGAIISLPPTTAQVFWSGTFTYALTAGLTIALVTPIALFASAGHGYLAPLGVVVLVIALAQVIAIAGWGEYFPWSIPGLYSQGGPLGLVSYLIVALTSIAGIAGTLLWWELADQTR